MSTRDAYVDFWATDGGLYMGIATDRTEGIPPPATSRPLQLVTDRMVVTLGPTGSGKTRKVLLPNIARLKHWSMVIVDVKGSLAKMTMAHRLRHGSEVIVFNPFNVHLLGTSSHNVIAALDPQSDDFPDDALGVAEALIRIEGKDPHFPQGAQEAYAGLSMYSRLSEPDGGSLAHVRSILGLPYKLLRDEIARALETAVAANQEETATKLSRLMDADSDNRELGSVISTGQYQTRWLDSRPIKACLSGRQTVDFASLKQRPITIYLVLPPNRLRVHSGYLRLMLTAILEPLMRDPRRGRVPVLFFLDEYYALARGGLPIVEDNMALLREFGVKLWTVLQDGTQARKLWGEGYESFISNGTLQAFAPQDVITADYLSQRTGQTRKEMLSRSHGLNQNPDGGRSLNQSASLTQNLMPLMLPQDLRNMDEGYSVIFSHRTKGTVRSYFPSPEDLPDIAPLAALAP